MSEPKFHVAFERQFKKHLKKMLKGGQYQVADFDFVYSLIGPRYSTTAQVQRSHSS